MNSGWRILPMCGVFFFLLAGARLGATDFIRGDVNGDGKVSLADAEYLDGYLFGKGECAPGCINSADANDDGKVNLDDAVFLMHYLVLGQSSPPAPFPSVGADPTTEAEDYVTCETYGGGFAIDDPGAQLEVLDASAVGGTDRRAIITVAVSSSHSILGYSGRILDGGGVVADQEILGGNTELLDLTGWIDNGFLNGKIENGRIAFGMLLSYYLLQVEIPAGQRVPALEMAICLKPGTAAGQYPLTLEAGELISGNYQPDPRDVCKIGM